MFKAEMNSLKEEEPYSKGFAAKKNLIQAE